MDNAQLKDNKKKRLAYTRGFGVARSFGGTTPSEVNSFITPQNSPTKFQPPEKSTPADDNLLADPVHNLRNRRILPPRPPSPLPGVSSIGVSVISPNPYSQTSQDQSLDWDNFIYSVPSNADLNLGLPNIADGLDGLNLVPNNTIQIVNTSESSLSVSSFTKSMSVFNNQQPDQMDSVTRSLIQQEMTERSNAIANLVDDFNDMLEDFTVDDVNRGNVQFVKEKLDEISGARGKARKAIREYQNLYGSYGDQDNRLSGLVSSMNSKVREHANSIWARVEELQQPESDRQRSRHRTLSSHEREQSEGKLSYEAKKSEFTDQVRLLKDSLNLPDVDSISDHWAEQTNSEVSKAMRKLSDWDKSLIRISTIFRQYEKLSKQFGEGALDRDAVLEEFISLRNKVKEVSITVQKEDEQRNLQTLVPNKSKKIKYPTFSGDPGEDLVKFKLRMAECFLKNQVPRSDQLDILRENLRGAALKRVPDTLKDLDTAWSNLNEAFGSPLIVLRERLKCLNKVGNIPPDTNAPKQIIWFHDFESILQDIIDLGTTDDMNLQMGAFGPTVQEQVLKAFNDNPYVKRKLALAGSGKQPREKMVAFKDKIIELRRLAQLAEVESSTSDRRPTKVNVTGSQPTSTTFGLTKNSDCRICIHLEATGKNSGLVLFERHLGKLPVGCPNFMALKPKVRRSLTLSVKLCQFCLSHDVIYSVSHGKECSNAKKKTKASYSCKATGCVKHFWVCTDHEEDNREKFVAANRKLAKHGLQVANLAVSLTANISCGNPAMERLASQVEKELVPVPEGEPIFLFFGAKGRSRQIMTFFDNGCSKFVIREEVIQSKELPATLIKKGPIFLGGVGDTRVYSSGEYLVAMDRDEKHAQTFQGLAVEVITGEFPKLDISSAVAAVKMDNQRNKYLQNCKFPKQIGGVVDALIGIQYNTCQPKLIHMMNSGLAIYETSLMPHTKNMRYILGGPHSSFDALLSRCPDANLLMQHFTDGISKWKNLGPPSLSQYIMSDQEVGLAKYRSACFEGAKDYAALVEFETVEVTNVAENLSNEKIFESVSPRPVDDCLIPDNSEADQVRCCADCGEEYVDSCLRSQELESLSQLKSKIDFQEAGLDITYRCVRCRNCVDCKNAEKIDKISLREEAELCEIKNSLNLDWEEKKIVCRLPLRGPERDFLSSNFDRAVKILNSQCKRYFSDPETKLSILTAFNKLFEKGYLKFIKDLPKNVLDKFIDKEVQYYLPWRIQFKPGSASTPARPVFDASSCTRKRQDGSAGRCLNDLVAKGPIDSLDLLKVTLRFMIGSSALVADLTKMYNQFHLIPENWNLQRILFKENLDPNSPIQEGVVCTLIYGVKSTSCQSETGLDSIADHIKDECPEVYKLLKDGRYVDNLLESKNSLHEVKTLGLDTTEVLDRLSLKTKGFTFSGEDPQPEETTDGISIDVNGYRWLSKLDLIEPKILPLHFGKKSRGRVVETEFFQIGGDFAKMNAYVPEKLTRRMIVSKRASLYETLGKLEPIKAKLKIDEREVVMLTSGWDYPVSTSLRDKLVRNFLLIEQLRGIRYSRARIPVTAVDTKMRLLTLVDAAEQIVNVATYCGFRIAEGGWSNQHLIGRSVLVSNTIPRNELQGLTGGSNLAWIVQKALYDWVDTSIVAGDSEIALHWNISDTRKLGIWHRNRVIQIRRGISLEDLLMLEPNLMLQTWVLELEKFL